MTYAVKVRPRGATAWFWLRDPDPLQLTTRRGRAGIGTQEQAERWARIVARLGVAARAVEIG